jgi:hypothetical protein
MSSGVEDTRRFSAKMDTISPEICISSAAFPMPKYEIDKLIYGGTAHKYCQNGQGSERDMRFQHFITFAIYDQKALFKH